MPYFSTQPSASLASSIRNMVAGIGTRGMASRNAEIAGDQAAATTIQHMALAEKAREEVEQMRKGARDREDPNLAREYATNVAGLDKATGQRLSDNLNGVLEQPAAADVDDAAAVGAEAQPFVTGAPNIQPGQRNQYQSAIASLIANRLGTGKTNADQLTQATGNIQKQGITRAALDAIDAGDVQRASAVNQTKDAGAIDLYKNVGNTGATFAPATGAVQANPTATPDNALLASTIKEAEAKTRAQATLAGVHEAQVGNLTASTGLHNAQTAKVRGEIAAGQAGATGAIGEEAIDSAAKRYNVDGTLPPNMGRGTQGAAITAKILNRAADLAREAGNDGEAQRIRQLANKGSASALSQLTRQEASIGAFEKNANKNADLALQASEKVDRTGVPVFNRWLQAGRSEIAGDPDTKVFNAANETFVSEYAKVMSGGSGAAASTEGAQARAHGLLSTAATKEQYTRVIAQLKLEMSNRMKGFTEQKDELTRSMGSGRAPESKPAVGWSIKKVSG